MNLKFDKETLATLEFFVEAIARGVVTAAKAYRMIRERKHTELMAEIIDVLSKDPSRIGMPNEVPDNPPPDVEPPPVVDGMPPYGTGYPTAGDIPQEKYVNGDLIYIFAQVSPVYFAVYPAVGYPGAPKPVSGELYGRISGGKG